MLPSKHEGCAPSSCYKGLLLLEDALHMCSGNAICRMGDPMRELEMMDQSTAAVTAQVPSHLIASFYLVLQKTPLRHQPHQDTYIVEVKDDDEIHHEIRIGQSVVPWDAKLNPARMTCDGACLCRLTAFSLKSANNVPDLTLSDASILLSYVQTCGRTCVTQHSTDRSDRDTLFSPPSPAIHTIIPLRSLPALHTRFPLHSPPPHRQ